MRLGYPAPAKRLYVSGLPNKSPAQKPGVPHPCALRNLKLPGSGPDGAAVSHGWQISLYLHVCHMLLDLLQLRPRMLGARSWN